MIKLKNILKENVDDFLDVVDTEDLWNIVSGPKGINNVVKKIGQEIDGLADDVKREVLDNLGDDEFKNHRREWKKLYKEINQRTLEANRAAFALYELGKKYAKWVESIKKVKK